MPHVLERPPAPPARRRKRLFSNEEERRSFRAGLLLTIVIWPLLVWILALAAKHLAHGSGLSTATTASPVFNIELTPEEYTDEPPPPDRFVETNPDAPENTPDQTRNFAARNQQVAQEKATPDGKSDTPELEGEKDREVTQIVSGELRDPEEPPPLPEAANPQAEVPPSPAQVAAQREQNPLPGIEKIEGENPDGLGTNVAEASENPSNVPEHVDGQKDPAAFNAPSMPGQPRIDPQRPQPRRRIERDVRPAILAENRLGTQNVGLTAIDARWSEYGEYLQKLVEAVQIQWERINDQSRVYPPPGSKVTVKFRLEAMEGSVSEILSSDSSGGKQAERACISAITTRSPYGKWSEEMVSVLGQQQDLTFTFHYQ